MADGQPEQGPIWLPPGHIGSGEGPLNPAAATFRPAGRAAPRLTVAHTASTQLPGLRAINQALGPPPPTVPPPGFLPTELPLPPGIHPLDEERPSSRDSDDAYPEFNGYNEENFILPTTVFGHPMWHATNDEADTTTYKNHVQVLEEASPWVPVRPEPLGGVEHKLLPDFEDPRWKSMTPSHSYVPYWTSPYSDITKEEDWRGQEYKQRARPEDRAHFMRPAILRHPVDEWVNRSDYAL